MALHDEDGFAPTAGREATGDRRVLSAAELSRHVPVALYMLAFVIQYASIFDNLVPQAARFARVMQLVVIVAYLAKAVALRDLALAACGAAGFGCLIFWHVLFCYQSGAHPNFNALLGYLPLLSFVPVAAASLPLAAQLRWLFVMAAGYLLLYVAGHGYFVTLTASAADAGGAGLLDSADDRGTRVYLASLLASYVALYAVEDREWPLAVRGAALAVALAATVMSQSRTFMLVALVILGLRLARLNGRVASAALSAVFLTVSASHLAGLFFWRWNPYSRLIADNSSYGRFLEYGQAIAAVREHWPIGLGIEPDDKAMGIYLNVPRYLGTIFWGDLGALGPLGQFGLPGLAFFLVVSVACLAGAARMTREGGLNAARLNAATSALYGTIAPTVLWPPGCFFTMLLLGIRLRERRLSMHEDGTRQWRRVTAAIDGP